MTKDEFQRATNDYMTRDGDEARAKAKEYNAIGVDNDTIIAVQFGEHWCLMLSKAYAFVQQMGIDKL